MAATLIRGSTQILDGSIPINKLQAGYSIPTENLAASADFVLRTGAVAFAADQSMGNFKLTTVADPVNAQDAVNLRTVQALMSGVGATKRARTLVTTNVALTGLQNFNGLTGVAGEVNWLNNQTTTSQNGFWQMNAGAWTRPAQWVAASTQKSFLLFIDEGTAVADTKWTVAADNIIVDTTSVFAMQDTTGAVYTADGTKGVLLTGNAFSVKLLPAGGLSFDGSGNTQVTLNGASLNVSASGLKISDGAAGSILMANATGLATYTPVSGDVAISNTGVATVATTGAGGFVKIGKLKANTTPAGAVNGVNTAFTLASTPVATTEKIFLNGQRLFPGAGNDYTIAGAAITLLFTPVTGDRISGDYLEA